ncbi:MAG: helix-turn-helix transcriptional regulator [Candidatus Puniceispirillaceae bacterium]
MLCAQLGISRSTVKRWIKDRDIPSPIQASVRELLFDVTAVQRWLDTKELQDD